jgi:enoyl-CoA hydratase/carnithine racemase
MAFDYERLKVEIDGRVAFATIDNPPINVMTLGLFTDLMRFGAEVAADDAVRAVVLRSANPEFFIAHFDVEAILEFPIDAPAVRAEHVEDNPFHAMCETYRTMSKPTIVELAGRVGGGGSELISSCDMRFGALGKAVINQPEVAIGILPGGSGTQRLHRLMGRGRALEVILGCEDLDAETAERWGYLNRALPADELRAFVERLARRIASFPPEAVALAKQSVDAAEPRREGLLEEAYLFQRLLRTDDAQAAMGRFMQAGGQTREGELRLAELCDEVASKGGG